MTESTESFTSEYPRPVGSCVHLVSTAGVRMHEATWDSARSLDDFIAQATVHQELWMTTRRLARISDAHRLAAGSLAHPLRLLVLLEDWCGDAIHTIPVVMRLVEATPAVVLRVVRRDEHDQLMDAHLTGTARAIPVVIAYGANGNEYGWWGPRPSALEAWVLRDGLEMEKSDRYRAIRTWYARDRGATTAAEVLTLLQHADSATSVSLSGSDA
ncbi:MAG: thioredoxin family protein [Gemmatimonadaceae bacterium]|nr:thioredoxin family protein [Gemmatimonadaceae bacterium]